ncbi:superoxide dismutase [Acrocarpospora sp. B8E8]|uniref:superoxide dismutase n=1 Tax=Acrocarpospora sp. B8E8 TaxID=3153572 RepID=UPI00325E00EE
MKLAVVLAGFLAALVAAPVAAAETGSGPVESVSASKTVFPTEFSLPDGFQPEGIAIGLDATAYFGSRATGAIYRADLRTGQGQIINPGPGTPSLGLKIDGRGRLFVSGGTGGNARVIDTRSGAVLASYQLASGAAFINDVVLTRHAAYFTDSTNPVLYKLPFGRHGELPAEAVTIPLSGDLVYGTGINSNGIAPAPDGKALLVIQSNTGQLFRVNPQTGVATLVETESLANGDGLLLEDRTLYVVQNRLNTVTVLHLDRHAKSGTVVRNLVDARFDVPTTVAAFRDRLYLPNARFTTTPTPTTPYTVVAIKRR